MKLRSFLCCAAILCCVVVMAADNVPDKKGMTVKGTVYADGAPLEGVVVSDGCEITTTDEDGCYWLASAKKNGTVFISIPSGYEVPAEWTTPKFWAHLEAPARKVEQHDFTLTKVDNDNHVLLAVTDMHLAVRKTDLEQFCTTFIPDIKEYASSFGDKRVYTMNLGDMSWDVYWYSNDYDISDYKRTIDIVGFPTPIFHVMGNHDNDPSVPHSDSTDYLASLPYREQFGPTYYSFNIGKVHYIVLDNIVYLNEPGGRKAENVAGSRNYDCRVTEDQLEWLKKDLSLVEDKETPIVVGMHSPVYRYKDSTGEVEPRFSTPEDSEALASCFEGFDQVHFLTGHSHRNFTTYVNEHLTEHNFGAVCASWWISGAEHYQNICPDASPAGYGVIMVDGKDLDWHYRTVSDGSDYQFRAADMNEVRNYYNASDELKEFLAHYPERTNFCEIEDNLVYINVWGWASDWTVSVTEDGKELEVEHGLMDDPMYTISCEIPRIRDLGRYTKTFAKYPLEHIFKVKASSATSTLVIKVTDHFGKVYTQTMERPKAFGPDMK